MKNYNEVDGYDLLEKLLSLSNDEGKLFIDKNSFLPYNSEKTITVKAVCSLMDAYDIKPKEEDYDGLNVIDDYMQCFIKEGFSEKRHKKTAKLLYRYIGIDDEIIRMVDNSLSNRKSRYCLFKYFFQYLKKIMNVDDEFAAMHIIIEDFLLSKVITEYAYGKRIDPLVKYYKNVLVLLMGDYADYSWDKDVLIKQYGYPGVPRTDDNDENDLPF